MFTFLSLIIFFGVLFIFGWQLVRFILSENRIEALIPLAAVVGFGIYLSFLNLFSYLIDIKINFYLLCIVFVFLTYFLFRFNKNKGRAVWGISDKWKKILFGTAALIMVITGIIGIRSISGDETTLWHLPFASTIAEGNFPVKAVFSPNSPSQYHYGNLLFLAAISKITHLPVWFSYDLHNSILIGVIFLLGFLLIKDFCKDNFKAYISSLIMLLGGSLNFLYGIGGLSSLYRKYILHLPDAAPFKFLSNMIFGKEIRGILVINHSQIAWIMLGFALTIAVIYLYFRAINDEKNWLKISLLTAIMYSFLALSAEVFFGAIFIVFLIYPLIFAILKKNWQKGKFYLKTSFLILFLGLAIASLQGGIVTQTIKQTFFGESFPTDYQFSITPEYLLKGLIIDTDSDGAFISIFSLPFFLGWGWLLIFIIPVATYLLKKYFQLGLFLILLIFISFFLPSVLIAGAWHGDFARINYLASFFWNLIFGLFLGWLFLFFKKKWQRLLIIILILGVTFQGFFYFGTYSIFPSLKRGRPFLQEPLKPNPAELEVFDWVKKHTTIKDNFLTFEEESKADSHNSKFTIYTGRFAPGFLYGIDIQHPNYFHDLETFIPEIVWYRKILKECGSADLKNLNYRYLYVNENWPEGLAEKCLANNDLELKFEIQEGNKFARIYKVLDD